MKVRPPKPFFFESGPRAVLLLHGFTGNSADVRQLGRYLVKMGYTCYAPHYKGHAVPPEELMRTSPKDWWQDVRDAWLFLNQQGYHEIAVCGLSIGGVFSLKCGYTFSVKGIVPMCAPAEPGRADQISAGVLRYAENIKRYQGMEEEERITELETIKTQLPDLIQQIAAEVNQVRSNFHRITAPIFIAQARHDEMIHISSANIIYNEVHSPVKQVKWYEESTHVITLGTEKKQLNQDIHAFLESLDWSVS